MIEYEQNGIIRALKLTEEECLDYIKKEIYGWNSDEEQVVINTIKFGNNIRWEFDFPATIYFDFRNRRIRLMYDVSHVRPEDPIIVRDCNYAGDKIETRYLPEKLIFEYYYSLFTFTYKANSVKAFNDCFVCLEYMKLKCNNPSNLSEQKKQDNISVKIEPLDKKEEKVVRQKENTTESNVLQEKDAIKGIQDKTASILRCPNCGKLTANIKDYCTSCYHPFSSMVFKPEHYLKPIKEVVFWKMYNINKAKRDYKRFCYVNSTSGIVFSPLCKEYKDEYILDHFAEPFEVKNGKIVVGESENYTIEGQYIYEESYYDGKVPERSFFESYFSKGKWTRPMWFLSDGTVMSFDGINHDSKVFDKGKYIRDNELIRTEITEVASGKKQSDYWLVVQGKLCASAWVSEAGMQKIREMNARPMAGEDYYGAVISKEEFYDNYPCQVCNARKAWNNFEWKYTPFGTISVSGHCKKCNNFFVESEEPETIKKIAYKGSPKNPYHKTPAGTTRYLDNPCPYCGAYQVRYSKWEDKGFSFAFWGIFSHKVHSNYKCENCGKMWE